MKFLCAIVGLLSLLISVTAASDGDPSYEQVAKFDGSIPILTSMYELGFGTLGDTNFALPCGNFASLGDEFVLEVSMGEFKDYLLPASGVQLCELLNSTAATGNYRYSSTDPNAPDWDGYSVPVGLATQWPDAVGGAPLGFLSGTATRNTIAFWGSNTEAIKGGCCYSASFEQPRWLQAFELKVVKMDPSTLYVTWVAKPAVVVQGAPIVFMAKIWNFAGSTWEGTVEFEVVLNKEQYQGTSNKKSSILFDRLPAATPSLETLYEVTLTVLTDIPGLTHRTLHLSLPVVPQISNVTACRVDTGITSLLHFGAADYSIGPTTEAAAMEDDWFGGGVDSNGGEAFLKPLEDHISTAQGDQLLGTIEQSWTPIESNKDGAFEAVNHHGTSGGLQFFAFVLYSAASQDAVLQIKATGLISLYIGHTHVVPPLGASRKMEDGRWIHTFSFPIKSGYHQVLVKLYTTELTSSLAILPIGTGLAFATETPMALPSEDAYPMWTDSYMFYLMNSGNDVEDVLSATTIEEDLIGIHSATPRANALVLSEGHISGPRWSTAVFSGGNIPISGERLPTGAAFAVRYVALALYNQYHDPFDVTWELVVKGKTDFYLDGEVIYAADEKTQETATITTTLTPGWHQMIVRIASPRDRAWNFRFYMYFSLVRLIGAPEIGNGLPPTVRVVRSGVPLQAMLELTSQDNIVPIPFNSEDSEERRVDFINEGLDLLVGHHYAQQQHLLQVGSAVKPYLWLPVSSSSSGGTWGGADDMGGSAHRFWAFSLYMGETGTIGVNLSYYGGLALWVDTTLTVERELLTDNEFNAASVELTLEAGWHQFALKLQSPNAFVMHEKDNLTDSWLTSAGYCGGTSDSGVTYTVCPRGAYCPLGVPRRGTILPVESDIAHYAPVRDHENEWVKLSHGDDAAVPLCGNHSEALLTGSASVLGVACCRAARPATVSLSLAIPPSMTDKVGYAHQHYVTLAAPTITVSPAYMRMRTVTITVSSKDTKVRYKVVRDGSDEALDWLDYASPFLLETTAKVLTQATLMDSAITSSTASLLVKIPSVVTVERHACTFGEPCPLVLSGVMPTWQVSLVSAALAPPVAQRYANIDFASQQPRSPIFSGVASVNAEGTAVVSVPAEGGEVDETYSLFVYNEVNGTKEWTVEMSATTAVIPTTIAAAADVVLQLQGGVAPSDALVFPQVALGMKDVASCDRSTCQTIFTEYSTFARLLSAAQTVQEDMSNFSGSQLTCMCICRSCYAREDTLPVSFVFNSQHVSAVSIHTAVLVAKSTTDPTITEPAKKRVAFIVFLILLPIVCGAMVGWVTHRITAPNPLYANEIASNRNTGLGGVLEESTSIVIIQNPAEHKDIASGSVA